MTAIHHCPAHFRVLGIVCLRELLMAQASSYHFHFSESLLKYIQGNRRTTYALSDLFTAKQSAILNILLSKKQEKLPQLASLALW